MRPLFAYLHAIVVPTSVFAAAEDWAAARGWPSDERTPADDEPGPPDASPSVDEGALHDRIRRAARELAGQMSVREPATVVDPFELTTSFDDMLAGS